MIKTAVSFTACLLLAICVFAQNVGINNTDPKAALDLNGGLRTRVHVISATAGSITIPANKSFVWIEGSPVNNLIVSIHTSYTDGSRLIIYNGTNRNGSINGSESIFAGKITEIIYLDGEWRSIGTNNTVAQWGLQGNSGISAATQFIGTLNDADLVFKRNNVQSGLLNAFNNNTSWGVEALSIGSTGTANTAIGSKSLTANTEGSGNTAIGFVAMLANTAGGDNTAVGAGSLRNNRQGYGNTAVGRGALDGNQFGEYNTAVGRSAMFNNVSGRTAVAVGQLAMFSNTSGRSNVAIGASALYANTDRSNLVAVGDSALYNNGLETVFSVDATNNSAVGSKSLFRNTTGRSNSALGSFSLEFNTSGTSNTAVGSSALRTNSIGEGNTAVGASSLVYNTLGKRNTAIGATSLLTNTTGSYNAVVGESAMLWNEDGSYNIAMGYESLGNNAYGSTNVALGTRALRTNYSGHGNVAIGAYAGYFETSSNKLYIENGDRKSDEALIYGDFEADSLLLNAKTINKFSLNVRGSNALEMGYGTPGKQTDAGKIQYGGFGDPAHWLAIVGGGTAALGGDRVIKLWSEGGLRIKGNALPNTDNGHSLGQSGLRWSSVWAVNGTINTSDANLKTNITHSPYGLNEVMQMNPVQYNWKTNPTEDSQIGFLAQDIQKIIPEAVVVPANGDPLGMKYTELIPVLVKAIQELQKQNFDMQKQIDTLKEQKH